MTVRVLAGDLATALAEAQDAFLASAGAEEWVLPAGSHDLSGEVQVGAAGRSLVVRGAAGCALSFDEGGLSGRGSVELRDVTIDCAKADRGVALKGDALHVENVTVKATNPDGACIALRAEGSDVLIKDCLAEVLAKTEATAIMVLADRGRVSGTRVAVAKGDEATGLHLEADEAAVSETTVALVTAEGAGDGARVFGFTQVEVIGLRVSEVDADRGRGIVLACTGRVLALDLEATEIEGETAALGIVACAGADLRLRGFEAGEVKGGGAAGVVVCAGSRLEVASGTISTITGATGPAAGARILLVDGAGEGLVRDVRVEAVKAPDPREAPAPPAEWWEWAVARVAALRELGNAPGKLADLPDAGDAAHDVVGLHVGAPVDALGAWRAPGAVGALIVEDLILHRIAGTALQVEGGLRHAQVRRVEAWTSARLGFVQAEDLLLAQLTAHRHRTSLVFGPGEIGFYDSILSNVPGGASPTLEDGAEVATVAAVFATGAVLPYAELGPLPYVTPGPATVPTTLEDGTLPPAVAVDLRLVAGASIAALAVAIPGDGATPYVGAHAPDADPRCEAIDPQPPVWGPAPAIDEASPVVTYTARDARSLLRLMLDRARVAMPAWTAQGPADFTRMLLELLADRLDHVAYAQEVAVAEGWLGTARLRRSVEDHARALDYDADPGLSATAMIRFRVDHDGPDSGLADLWPLLRDASPELPDEPSLPAITDGAPLEVPAGTLVGNAASADGSVIFATEETLTWLPELDALRLAEDVPAGACEAVLEGALDALERGRWVVFSRGPRFPVHVVQITLASPIKGTDTTWIAWDPRRPSPLSWPAAIDDTVDAEPTVLFGNVVPAHHGVPIGAARPEDPVDPAMERWQRVCTFTVDGAAECEVEVPLSPLAVQAAGYPRPGEEGRRGVPRIRVSVEDDPWTLATDLSIHGPTDEVFVLRPAEGGRSVLRFGDGVNGAPLPARPTTLHVDVTIGRGEPGNVGAGALTSLVKLGPVGPDRFDLGAALYPSPGPVREDALRRVLLVDNPGSAVGGREPEALASIRYAAPRGVKEALSAVTPADAERLLCQDPAVAAARARVIDAGLRTVVQVTVLLRDVDSLVEAEVLRRWAVVRRRLEDIRLLGFDVECVPPIWVPLDLDLVVEADDSSAAVAVKEGVERRLTGEGGLFDPDVSGLGGDVHLSALYQAVLTVEGVRGLNVRRFRRLEPHAPERREAGVIAIGSHEVATLGGPFTPDRGLLTVSVCGGLR